jgi:protein-disulfide isomerase
MTRARRTRSVALLLGLACAGVFGGNVARAFLDVSTATAPAAALAIDETADLIAGPADARVTVRIFGDYECAACRQLELSVGDALLHSAAAGTIRIVYLHRPLATRRDAALAAAAIACVPEPLRRWQFHRALYRRGAEPSSSSAPLSERVVKLIGADSALASCARSDPAQSHARRSLAAARAAGFHEVPTVLVNDQHVRFRTYAALVRHIGRTAARRPAALARPAPRDRP